MWTTWTQCSLLLLCALAAARQVPGRRVPAQALDVTATASSEAVGEAPESLANGTMPSLLSENERQSFLEWILSLTGGGTTTQEPDLDPVVPTACAACTCGLTNKRTRIVGGQPVQVNQYVWMALLMYDGRFYCGGTLISSKYIMTASHCVDGFQRKKMSARLLEHDRGTTSEAKHVDRKIARVLKHPGYSDVTFNNDIALLRLDKEVAFDDTLRPACLPPAGKSFSGRDGVVTGWGVSTPGGSTNQVLHEVAVPIMSNKDCRKSNYGAKRITDNMLCAGYPEGKKDSCQGDSGGPLHIVNGTFHHVVGVVSWGEGCARPKYPGVYARVNRYLTWIKRNTKDSCFCDQQGNGFTHFPAEGASGVAGPAANGALIYWFC
ncbi:trypsin-1-like [Thrips palmi]|uniref:Trypsin-1-like n=1 Tax=Thrips palmi TaxID=161013 RepID=A0A6P8ZZM3_THRPL|nr:trypsin-1-like [Thrips palmi]